MENQNREQNEWVQTAALKVLVVAFAVVVLGTVAIPAALAFLYAWQWLLCYPLALLAVFGLAEANKRH